MKQTDQQLILACRRGDQSAWELLVNRYQRLIYTIPRRAGLDEDQAADVFQEVFTTLFQKLNEIEQPERLQAWLVTTARRKTWRVIVNTRDSRRRTADDEDDKDELAALPDNAPLADEVMLRLEEQHGVRCAIAQLNERCQKLISFLFYSDETPAYAEIARSLGTSEGSIGPTRARCLEKLLRLLDK
ncbi:MAG: putative polymerase ECF-type sigma factor [Acidobacteria bacterium]|nr:putative polymerase ECF-type sigma factor [Acidobacteriota bacterium]